MSQCIVCSTKSPTLFEAIDIKVQIGDILYDISYCTLCGTVHDKGNKKFYNTPNEFLNSITNNKKRG